MPTLILIAPPEHLPHIQRIAGEAYTIKRYESREGYIARLADDHAAFVIIEDADWRFWVVTPKTSPATRRIPILLINPDAAQREQALAAGADFALAPDQLPDQLPDLLRDHARVLTDAIRAELDCQCAEPMPPEGLESIRLFNAGEYYAQHDAFEALWVAEGGAVRDLYRAVLQVGVAYYQITRGNLRGAHKMLLRAVQWLTILPDVCRGVDVARLRADADAVRAELERVQQQGGTFDRTLLKPVQMR